MKLIVYKNSKIVHGILNQGCWKNSSGGEIWAKKRIGQLDGDETMRGGITMGQPTIHLLKSCVGCVAREAWWCTMPALPLKAFECPPHFCLSAVKKLKTCSPAIHYPGPIRYRCRSCEWNIGQGSLAACARQRSTTPCWESLARNNLFSGWIDGYLSSWKWKIDRKFCGRSAILGEAANCNPRSFLDYGRLPSFLELEGSSWS